MQVHFPDDPNGDSLEVDLIPWNLGRKTFNSNQASSYIKLALPQCSNVVFNGMMASSDFFPIRPNFVRFVLPGTIRNPRLQFEEEIYPIWDSHASHSFVPSLFRDQLRESNSNTFLLGKGIEHTPEDFTCVVTSFCLINGNSTLRVQCLTKFPILSRTLFVSFITLIAVSRIFFF